MIALMAWMYPGTVMADTGEVWVMPCTEILDNYQDFPAKESNLVVLGKGETEHVQLVLSTIPKENISLRRRRLRPVLILAIELFAKSIPLTMHWSLLILR